MTLKPFDIGTGSKEGQLGDAALGLSRLVSAAPDRCLRSGKPSAPCMHCSDACPVGAVSLQAQGVAFSAYCVACGSCVAACPTGAIEVVGFEPPRAAVARLRIECSRVPSNELESETWVVPCTAAVRISDIVDALSLDAATQHATVQFVDRGLCSDCRVSAGRPVIAESAARLSRTLDQAELRSLKIIVTHAALNPSKARSVGVPPERSRRAFLRALIQPSEKPARPHGLLDDRAALAKLASHEGRQLGADQFPAIVLTSACRDHAICTASCPTGALRRETRGDSGEIRRFVFQPVACLACGRCADVCPEKALVLSTAGDRDQAALPVVLRQTTLPVCWNCEEVFVDAADEDLCPACRKSNSLFSDLFTSRARAGASSANRSTDQIV